MKVRGGVQAQEMMTLACRMSLRRAAGLGSTRLMFYSFSRNRHVLTIQIALKEGGCHYDGRTTINTLIAPFVLLSRKLGRELGGGILTNWEQWRFHAVGDMERSSSVGWVWLYSCCTPVSLICHSNVEQPLCSVRCGERNRQF